MNDIKYGRKRRGIQLELNEVISNWVATIDDPLLAAQINANTIITGGSICSMLMGDPVNDYDIYFKTLECTKAVAEYYVTKFNDRDVNNETPYVLIEELDNILGETETRVCIRIRSSGMAEESDQEEAEVEEIVTALDCEVDEKNQTPYRPVFMSENAITLSDKMQLITRFYGPPDEIHNNYDFAHAKCYYDYSEQELYLDPLAMEMMLSRTLRYEGSLYPVASIFRMKKFLERGWRITAGEQLKIMWQISEIDLSDIKVLREQLTGVDAAYLHTLINSLENSKLTIDSSYVCKVIDKIFN